MLPEDPARATVANRAERAELVVPADVARRHDSGGLVGLALLIVVLSRGVRTCSGEPCQAW